MGLRLSFGVGPLRASIPLTRRRRGRCRSTGRAGNYQAQRGPSVRQKAGHPIRAALGAGIGVIVFIGIIGSAFSGHNPATPPASPAAAASSVTPTPSKAAHHATKHHRKHRRHHHHAVTVVPVVTQTPTAASCYPLSDEDTCYEPGEYCRYSDEGASGVDGHGQPITCEDNDGWRWEPS